MHRLPLTPLVPGEHVIPDGAARYLSRVLRLRVGDTFEAFDPRAGTIAPAKVTSVAKDVRIEVGAIADDGARASPLVLVQGYPKGDKLGDVVRDATELGATVVVPAICTRSIARPEAHKSDAKIARLATIATEAARQCGRTRAPDVAPPMPLLEALELAASLAPHRFVLYERATEPLGRALVSMAHDIFGVAFVIGPEGGFAEEEIEAAIALGYLSCSLGPFILRTETAATTVLGAFRVLAAR